VRGQKIDIQLTRSVEETTRDGRACWRVTNASTTPMGNSNDAFDVDRATLEPVARETTGRANIKIQYAKDRVNGQMAAGGQTMPVDVKLDAPVLGDGPAFEATLAGLPLAAGYSTTYRVFEPMTQKVRPMKLEVTGEETVSVAAGSFPALVVKVTPLDDESGGTSTVRVMKAAPHWSLRSETKLPAMMGGGQMVTELQTTSSGSATVSR